MSHEEWSLYRDSLEAEVDRLRVELANERTLHLSTTQALWAAEARLAAVISLCDRERASMAYGFENDALMDEMVVRAAATGEQT